MTPTAPPGCRGARARARGFTAIELMATVAILGILVALALPSFNTLVERFRVSRAQEDFASTYYFARSEAIRRGGAVVMKSAAGNACTPAGAADWGCGWLVFHDANGDGEQNADSEAEETLQRGALPNGLQLTMRPARAQLSFDRWGFPENNRFFHLETRPRGAAAQAAKSSCLIVSIGGRLSRTRDQVTCRQS